LPISLRDPEIPFCERHAAADRIGDPLGHPSHREATVESEAVAAQVAPGVLGKVEGVEGTAEAGLEATQIVGFFEKWDEMARIKRQIKRSILDQPFGNKALVDAVTERFLDLGKRHFR